MLMLSFRFKGTRKVVASRLMSSRDFRAELEAHLPVLDNLYSSYQVSAVEIISYQRGKFYYDPWPEGLKLVQDHCLDPGATEDHASALPQQDASPLQERSTERQSPS